MRFEIVSNYERNAHRRLNCVGKLRKNRVKINNGQWRGRRQATGNTGAKRGQQTADRLPHHNKKKIRICEWGLYKKGGHGNVGDGRSIAITKCEANYTKLYRTKANWDGLASKGTSPNSSKWTNPNIKWQTVRVAFSCPLSQLVSSPTPPETSNFFLASSGAGHVGFTANSSKCVLA